MDTFADDKLMNIELNYANRNYDSSYRGDVKFTSLLTEFKVPQKYGVGLTVENESSNYYSANFIGASAKAFISNSMEAAVKHDKRVSKASGTQDSENVMVNITHRF